MNQVPEALDFDGPGSMVKINWDDHKGQLAMVWARSEKPFTWEGETKDVIEADVVVVDPPGGQPIEYRGVLIFPRVMQGQIRGNLGRNRANVGRVGKGEAKPRQTAPWILLELSEEDKKLAVAYLKKPNARPADQSASASAPSWGSDEPPF